MKEKEAHSYTILLPVPGEELGRWLERNGTRISISCTLGTYVVRISQRRQESYEKTVKISVDRSTEIEVISLDKTLEAALLAAMQKCEEQSWPTES